MFPIGAVERDTGIARDTLRIWERRYDMIKDTHIINLLKFLLNQNYWIFNFQ